MDLREMGLQEQRWGNARKMRSEEQRPVGNALKKGGLGSQAAGNGKENEEEASQAWQKGGFIQLIPCISTYGQFGRKCKCSKKPKISD